MNRKLLTIGLPIVLGVMLVAATIIFLAYNHNFTKTINVFNTGGSNEYVTITGSGDITSSVINCENLGNGCSVESGDITLTNTDTASHDCSVTTTASDYVDVTYSIPVPITIAGGDSATFKIKYESRTAGSYPMTTTINCP